MKQGVNELRDDEINDSIYPWKLTQSIRPIGLIILCTIWHKIVVNLVSQVSFVINSGYSGYLKKISYYKGSHIRLYTLVLIDTH